MAIIKQDDIIKQGQDPLEGLKKSLIETDKIVDKLTKSNEALANSMNLVKKSGGGEEARQLSAAINKVKKSTTELTEVQKQRIKIRKQLDTAIAKSQTAQELNNKQLIKAKVAAQETAKSQKQLARESLGLVNAYEKLSKRTNDAQKKFKNLAAQYGVTSKQAQKARLEFDKLDKELRSVNNAAKDGRRDVGRYGIALKGVGSQLLGAAGIVGGVTALVGVVKSSIKIFKDFSKSSSKLAAILGKSKSEISDLTKQAKLLGSTTAFTASEVISLQTELAKLGFSLKEIENSTPGILDLAAATGQDLAQSAELAGATLRIFNLDASEMNRVTDVLAKSTTISSLSMEKLATIMPTVGKTAQLAGVSLEKTAALAGTLTDRGLDASSAATSLRNIFLELSKKGITWAQAMEKINNSTDKNKTSMDLFGKRAAAAGSILAETSKDTDKLTESLNNSSGAAKEMADVMLDNLAGDMTKAQSAWEGFILSLESGDGIISKVFRTLTQRGTGLINMLTALNTEYTNSATKAEALNDAGREAIPLWDFQMKSIEALLPILKKAREESERIAALRGKRVRGLKDNNLELKKFIFTTEILTSAEASELRELIKKLKHERESNDLGKVKNALLAKAIDKLDEYNRFQAISTEKEKEKTKATTSQNKALREKLALQKEAERRAGITGESEQVETIKTVAIAEGVTGGFDPIKSAEETTKEVNEVIAEENEAFRESELEKELAFQEAKKELVDSFISGAIDFAKEAVDVDVANRQAGIEAQAEAEKKVLQDQLDKGIITKEEFAAKTIAIDKKARNESAKAEKRGALYKIGIDTATAIVKALASSAPPFNFINAGLVAAQGALQAALVAAKPLPAFKDGVIGYQGKGTGTSDSNTVRISNKESIITAKGTANAPIALDAINRGLLTDSQISSGLTPSQSEGLKLSMLMQGISNGNKISENILTALLNGGYALPFDKNTIIEKRADGTEIKHKIS